MARTAHDDHIGMLIKLAHDYPEVRDHVMPVIRQHTMGVNDHVASTIKNAFSSESEEFVAWCLMKDNKLSVSEVQRVLDKIGIPMEAPKEKGAEPVKRVPLAKGELVQCFAKKNTNPLNTQACEEHDEQVGTITDVDGDALVVDFNYKGRHGGVARFEGKESGMKTGLYRYKEISDETGNRAGLEVVYIRDQTKIPSADRMEKVREYVEKGFAGGENRSEIYYSGVGTKQAMGKDGYYFAMFARQRTPPFVNFNPTKGQVLYVGLLGHRPGGWKQDFAKMVAKDLADD